MHVCMHACVYVCMHVCMYICMHACMYVLNYQVGLYDHHGTELYLSLPLHIYVYLQQIRRCPNGSNCLWKMTSMLHMTTSLSVCIYGSVCACGWVGGWVCTCVCMYVCMYACMHACMHARMHVCIYVCMYVCMCARMYVCTLLHAFLSHPVRSCAHAYVHTHTHTHTCMRVYTYVYIFTHP
jgi:hypothetical protein